MRGSRGSPSCDFHGNAGAGGPEPGLPWSSGGEDLKLHVRASVCESVFAHVCVSFRVHMLVCRSMNVSTGNVCK